MNNNQDQYADRETPEFKRWRRRIAHYHWKLNVRSKRIQLPGYLKLVKKIRERWLDRLKNGMAGLTKKIISKKTKILNKKIKNKRKFYANMYIKRRESMYENLLINKKSTSYPALCYKIYKDKYLTIFSPKDIKKRNQRSRAAKLKIREKLFERYDDYNYYKSRDFHLPPHLLVYRGKMKRRATRYYDYFKANKPFQLNKNMDNNFIVDFMKFFVGSYIRRGGRQRVCRIIKKVLVTLKRSSKFSFIKILKLVVSPLRLIVTRKSYRFYNEKYLQPLLPKRAIEEAKCINLYLKKRITGNKRWSGDNFYTRLLEKFKSLIKMTRNEKAIFDELRRISKPKKLKHNPNYKGKKKNYDPYYKWRQWFNRKQNAMLVQKRNEDPKTYLGKPHWMSKLRIEKIAGGITIPNRDLDIIKVVHGLVGGKKKISPARRRIREFKRELIHKRRVKWCNYFKKIVKNYESKKTFQNDVILTNKKKKYVRKTKSIISRYYNKFQVLYALK